MAEFIIPADHPCLPGHFPGQPIVPGVVVLDRVLAAIEAQHGAFGALRMPQVKFLQPLLPEQTARIELQRLSDPSSDASDTSTSDAPPRWRFRVLHDEALIASGEVHAA
jgi:3-hydroxyacyl-[acyl-carrier-protein] dehydratase